MNIKQQQLTFEKGITNIPSDNMCSDNTLEECVGMVYENGEHRVIQKPKVHSATSINKKILYIHKFNDQEKYIVRFDSNGRNVYAYYSKANGNSLVLEGIIKQSPTSLEYLAYDSSAKLTSIGKTLIISDKESIKYAIWKNGSYSVYTTLPLLSINPALSVDSNPWVMEKGASGTAIKITPSEAWAWGEDENHQEEYNTLAVGLYDKTLKKLCQKKRFAKPFFVRAALEMYDGTFTQVTAPILMWPTFNGATFGDFDSNTLSVYTPGTQLLISQLTDYSDFSDIVKGITIFVSNGINVYDTTVDQKTGSTTFSVQGSNAIYLDGSNNMTKQRYPNTVNGDTKKDILTQRPWAEIIREIRTTSIFYKLCTLDLKGTSNSDSTYKSIDDNIDVHTLENLTTQDRLDTDDYYSRCSMSCDFIYAYNSRLNIAGIKRKFFDGFDCFMPVSFSDNQEHEYAIYVTILPEDGNERIVCGRFRSKHVIKDYFYYPDSRATRAQIFIIINGNYRLLQDVQLTEHEGLNGAIYLSNASSIAENWSYNNAIEGVPPTIADEPEYLSNQIAQSQVNNPFTFLAEGYHTIGNGRVIGISSLTQALSQGQFGQYPVIVFTTDGMWAMSVGNTGIYTNIHPMSREVALESNPCITQTDGAIFFASAKGLMVVVGGDVKCVSSQLSGKACTRRTAYNISEVSFQEYLEHAFIAYDYRDSLLWIFNRDSGFEEYCYIYSIKSGTFSKFLFDYPIESVVNNYPDYLLQDSQNKVFTLLGRSNINNDNNPYYAQIVTRPMKLENALALKSILEVKHIRDINGKMVFAVYASNNMQEWVKLSSLRGMPWKYYKFNYTFTNLLAIDRFAGTILVTQERRTDKLR